MRAPVTARKESRDGEGGAAVIREVRNWGRGVAVKEADICILAGSPAPVKNEGSIRQQVLLSLFWRFLGLSHHVLLVADG